MGCNPSKPPSGAPAEEEDVVVIGTRGAGSALVGDGAEGG